MIMATIDTNVLVSAIAGFDKAASTPGAILRHFSDGVFDLVLSNHILDELSRTMTKPYFARNPVAGRIVEIVRLIDEEASVVSITAHVVGIATHPEDDLVLATAVSGNADYLVTGDRGLLSVGSYLDFSIVTARDFLTALDTDSRYTTT